MGSGKTWSTLPAGGSAAGPAAAMGPAAEVQAKVPDRADEARIWKEFVKEEKTLYTITYSEGEGKKKLELRVTHYPLYPYGNYVSLVHNILWDGGDVIEISAKVVRDSWYGTGCEKIARVVIDMFIPETPWYFFIPDLEREIVENGAKEVVKKIIRELAEYAAFAIKGWEE